MNLIIDGKKFLNWLIWSGYLDNVNCGDVKDAIEKCRIIPDNATNGDVIEAMFPDAEIEIRESESLVYVTWHDSRIPSGESYYNRFRLDWWNAPYKDKGLGNER